MKTLRQNTTTLAIPGATPIVVSTSLDRGAFRIDGAETSIPWPAEHTVACASFDAAGAFAEAVASLSPAEPFRNLVTMPGHRGRWLMRNCKVSMQWADAARATAILGAPPVVRVRFSDLPTQRVHVRPLLALALLGAP